VLRRDANSRFGKTRIVGEELGAAVDSRNSSAGVTSRGSRPGVQFLRSPIRTRPPWFPDPLSSVLRARARARGVTGVVKNGVARQLLRNGRATDSYRVRPEVAGRGRKPER